MKIGIIGGGQLGMMMAESAKVKGHYIVSLDPNPNCSITKYSDMHIAKDYNDEKAIQLLSKNVDVITYEFENVDLNVLKKYQHKIPQKLLALEISKNRLNEKNFATKNKIPTPKYVKVESKQDIFYPSIIKTMTGGYDGKGQYKINDQNDIDQFELNNSYSYICESFIPFDYEISVIATRDQDGMVIHFPIPINTHKNGILHTSIIEDEIPTNIKTKATHYTTKILNQLDYVGTLAVEYFVHGDQVIFNEFAPRPHNSGHYTIDGCDQSQFDTHIAAITGEELTMPKLLHTTMMINVLGQNKAFYDNAKRVKNAVVKDYLKNSTKRNRKIGHINIPFSNKQDKTAIYQSITKELSND